MSVRLGRWIGFVLLLPYFSVAAFAQSEEYDVIDLGTLPGGSGMVRGINNSGHVVGRSGTEFNTGTRGFIWSAANLMQAAAAADLLDRPMLVVGTSAEYGPLTPELTPVSEEMSRAHTWRPLAAS